MSCWALCSGLTLHPLRDGLAAHGAAQEPGAAGVHGLTWRGAACGLSRWNVLPRGAGDTNAVCPSCHPVNPGTTGNGAEWRGVGCNEQRGPGSASRSALQATASRPPRAVTLSGTGAIRSITKSAGRLHRQRRAGRRVLRLPSSISIVIAPGERTEPGAEAAA